MIDKVLDFINRKFPNTKRADSDWLNGSCFYFSIILKERFSGKIYYDVIHGHFLTLIGDGFFDATGLCYKLSKDELERVESHPGSDIALDYGITIVQWDSFDQYDSVQKKRIERDCIL